jgi:hypothetical protein
MGGKAPYDFHTEPIVINGVNTKRLVANPDEQEIVKLMFEMYEKPEISYGDIARDFTKKGISIFRKKLTRASIACLLRNPVYVQADLDVYEFFKSQGAVIENSVEDFTGLNGCYLYKGRDVNVSKRSSLKGHNLVVAPHEGFIPSDVWLRCRRKLMNNTCCNRTGNKAKRTWLSGKIKCGKCGYALVSVSVGKGHLYCNQRRNNKSCEGCGTIRSEKLETLVFNAMVQRMLEFKTLCDDSGTKVNPKLTAFKVELAKVESEIEKLVDTLTGANPTLLSYANKKIEALDDSRQALTKKIADMSADAVSPAQMLQITSRLNDWDNVEFNDRRNVVDVMISVIRATSENIDIEWKI